ncbi:MULTISPECIES: DNA polymerase III subunit chi [Hydrogenophaga]|uniref:DNA polymerase III subunit chi n=1 Tax=Hydrogenophaga electricum TaxID=1230953 RepID=A0ABQ6BY40_9BURK|nr:MULTISPECIES: DNA polymerase III subunit chi [Hydrogenophaga]GLS12872.1 DNA polymerase III subunit chi [Hydrogenophaga electricum]
MSEVAFHFNAPERVAYACRLLRKAYLKGARVLVWIHEAELPTLDTALWTFAQGEFVAHARARDPEPVRRHAPILLTDDPDGVPFEADVLVNLAGSWTDGFTRFGRVIEVVTQDPQDRAGARERWMRYRQQGFEPLRHDLALAPGT